MGGPSKGGNDTDVSGAEAVATNKKTYADKKIKIQKNLDLFHDDPYDNPQGGPLVLKPFEPLFDAGAKKTRQFFTDKVLTSERGQKNIGYTQAEFSRLSRTEQEKVYKDYRTSRQAGHTDAYGNLNPNFSREKIRHTDKYGNVTYKEVIMSKGNEDNYGGVPGAKSEVQPKVASQMDNSGVKSKLITADKTSPTSVEMNLTEDQRMAKVKRKGRQQTLLTDLDENKKPTLSKKILLGNA